MEGEKGILSGINWKTAIAGALVYGVLEHFMGDNPVTKILGPKAS